MTIFYWSQTPYCASNDSTCEKCGAKPGEGCKYQSLETKKKVKKVEVTSNVADILGIKKSTRS